MSAAGFVQELLTPADLAARPDVWWRGVLGVVGCAAPPPLGGQDLPTAVCGTPPLDGSQELCEVWRAAEGGPPQESTRTASSEAMRFRSAAGITFGAVRVDERGMHRGGGADEAEALREATGTAYGMVFDALERACHPWLVRVWHYLPDINREVGGEERYRLFNSARRAAFERRGLGADGSAPAATAVGSTRGGPLTIYFLAAAVRPIMIENPRQISAYHYPPRYGRASPLFSRACLLPDSQAAHLFVSGTASIVGHRTVHAGDAAAQAGVALDNLSIIVEQAERLRAAQRQSVGALCLKVYLRRAADLDAVRSEIGRRGVAAGSVAYLRADICRTDLLVEIEGYARLTRSTP
ncbi:MAG TPA: hypothetical protein VND80_04340 [Steroidobacteraceae bacterium]|nr:hypothetical protein [Steroidobacteraceae bacterium]